MESATTTEVEFNISNYIDICMRRRWIILSVAVMISLGAILITYTTTPIYQSSALLLIEKERSGGGISQEHGGVENTQEDYYNTQFQLLKSYTLLEEVYKQLDLQKHAEFAGGVGALSEAISISPLRGTRLLHVSVDAHNPGMTARIANTLAQNYVKQNLNNQLFISQDILKALKSDPNTAEGELAASSLPSIVGNELIRKLKIDLINIESQKAELSRRYKERHPAIASLDAQLATLRTQIKGETNRAVQSLKAELSGKLKGNNVRIVDPARVPGGPYKPNKPRGVGLGVIAGLVAGMGLAFLIEVLDQSIRTSEDVERKLQLPSLGIIPFLPQDENKPVYSPLTSEKLSLSSEAFRNMRTMVDLAGVSEDSGEFLITSTVQSEGKTHIASNLAVAFSQLGQSVLLIDGDMRRPKLHKVFRLTSQRGLSTYLASGKDVDEIEPLVQSSQVPDLSVLVCGPRPPNPSELLNTPRVSALVAWAKTRYDRVIVDCPPIFPIHDTLLWGKHIRSCVFTVRYGKTRAPLINSAHKALSEANIKLLGIAVNAAKSGGLAHAGYGYYYEQYYQDPEHQAETAKTV